MVCNDIDAIDNYIIFITNMLSVTTLTKSYQESIDLSCSLEVVWMFSESYSFFLARVCGM